MKAPDTDTDTEIWLLRTKPSVRRWSVEVREIVNGGREDAIAHFGSAPGYVKSLLFNSRESATTEYCFDEALRRVIETWHPLANPDSGRDFRVLQLLGAFTPSEGLSKCLTLLRSFNALIEVDGRARRLKPIVLQVLEQYLPVEQPPFGAFSEYLVHLSSDFVDPDYAVYAVARLRELRKLDATDVRLQGAIKSCPRLLEGLLAIFTPSLREDKRDLRYLSSIYRHCLHLGPEVLAEFDAALGGLGFSLFNDKQGPSLKSTDGGWSIKLALSEEDLGLYYARVYVPLSQADIGVKLKEVLAKSKLEETPVPYELELVSR